MARTSYKSPELGGLDPASGHSVGVVTCGWLRFETGTARAGRRTLPWRVRAKDGGVPLGQIEWHSRWRRYVFEPEAGTLYEEDCLRVIAAFVENLTRQQRATWRPRRVQTSAPAETSAPVGETT